MTDSRRVAYVHSEELIQAADVLPANEGRASLVHSLCSAYGLLDDGERDEQPRARLLEPIEATRDELLKFHDRAYVDAILGDDTAHTSSETTSNDDEPDSDSSAPSLRTFGLANEGPSPRKRRKTDALGLQDDCPRFDALDDYVRLVAGASLTAARELRDGKADVAIAWTGGRHHAKRGEASGFCYVNDIVLAIMELRTAPRPPSCPSSSPSSAYSSAPALSTPRRLSRVLYLDLDLHHGDAVEAAFHSTPYVLTLSLHLHAPLFFPSTGSLFSTGPGNPKGPGAFHALNVALESGLREESLARVWKSCVEKVKEAYQPDAVVVQCGVDGLAGDPCKEWNLSLSALGACVRQALSWDKPTLLLGGGGYSSPNAAKAWAYLTSVALDRPLPLSSPIPPDGLSTFQYASFAPSFTLDVPAIDGVRDRNTDETLEKVEKAFEEYAGRLREKYKR
ncbi:hypothetical protein JCM1840_004043 [Sporobolomyces johnsonii]